MNKKLVIKKIKSIFHSILFVLDNILDFLAKEDGPARKKNV